MTSMAAAPGVKTPATEAAPTIANEPARFAANDTERTRSASTDGAGRAWDRKFAVTSSDLDSTMSDKPTGNTTPRTSAWRPGSPASDGAPPATTIIRMLPQLSMAPPRKEDTNNWSLPRARWATPRSLTFERVLFESNGGGGVAASGFFAKTSTVARQRARVED